MTLPSEHPALSRIQQNVLARLERRLLTWLCARLPAWVTPDQLTSLGMVGAAGIFLGYALSGFSPDWLFLALAGYVVQWFGDSLDGSLARFRHIERPSYGYFIDHSCDGLAVLMILAGMGLSPFVTMDIAMIALAGYLLLSIHAFLSARVMGELKLSYLAAGPTELRVILIALTIAMYVQGKASDVLGDYSGYDLLVGGAGTILIILFVIQTISTGRHLARIDRR
ncbi:MAG TPA: CDP-alcohol phosphatidyltransferase family protein [Sphingomonas sp.]|nr:CDP-alcohol phosphatidyltransferase family protein [Sphingomonas sp.]